MSNGNNEIKSFNIYINIVSSIIEINNEFFIPGEWVHKSDHFSIDRKIYPMIKTPSEILESKWNDLLKIGKISIDKYGNPIFENETEEEDFTLLLEEYGLDQFSIGLEEAAIKYKWKKDMTVEKIEKLYNNEFRKPDK
jgi:hypothetical protein